MSTETATDAAAAATTAPDSCRALLLALWSEADAAGEKGVTE